MWGAGLLSLGSLWMGLSFHGKAQQTSSKIVYVQNLRNSSELLESISPETRAAFYTTLDNTIQELETYSQSPEIKTMKNSYENKAETFLWIAAGLFCISYFSGAYGYQEYREAIDRERIEQRKNCFNNQIITRHKALFLFHMQFHNILILQYVR